MTQNNYILLQANTKNNTGMKHKRNHLAINSAIPQ